MTKSQPTERKGTLEEENECQYHNNKRLENIKRDRSREREKRKQFNIADVTGFMTKGKPTERKK